MAHFEDYGVYQSCFSQKQSGKFLEELCKYIFINNVHNSAQVVGDEHKPRYPTVVIFLLLAKIKGKITDSGGHLIFFFAFDTGALSFHRHKCTQA